MRKAILFLGLAVGLMSCEDEIVFNETTLQAKISAHGLHTAPNQHIRFDYHEAFVDNGNLLIKGGTERDTLEISIPNYAFGTRYELNNNNFSAKYKTISEDSISWVFETNVELDGYVFLNPAEEQTPQSISGSFAFDMDSNTVIDGSIDISMNVRLHDGAMLNIPINNTPPVVIDDEDLENPEG